MTLGRFHTQPRSASIGSAETRIQDERYRRTLRSLEASLAVDYRDPG